MADIMMEIPDDLERKLKNKARDVGGTLRLAAAFSLCQRGELSTSQAARLAALTYADFLEAAARARIELFPVDLEELREEISRGYTLGRQRIAGDSPGPRGIPAGRAASSARDVPEGPHNGSSPGTGR